MDQPRHQAVRSTNPLGFHRVHYCLWEGASASRWLVCVHGLTRNARDFDWLARAAVASGRYTVVAIDIAGRGESDWLPDAAFYGFEQYVTDVTTVLAHVGADRVDWMGTSMGGLLGMIVAARTGHPVDRLVLNDVGPTIPGEALTRIGDYIRQPPEFADAGEVETYLRSVYAPFGIRDDAVWKHYVTYGTRTTNNGSLTLNFDPKLARPFLEGPSGDVDLWQVWDSISVPVLCLRGADSDLLLPETLQAMKHRGPRAEGVTIPGCGHAPALVDDDQIALILDWLATRRDD